MYTHLLALFTTDKKWKQPECSLLNEQIEEMWHLDTMKSSAYERKQIRTHATTRMRTEDVLSEVSQSQRTYTVWFHFSQIQTESRAVDARLGRVSVLQDGRGEDGRMEV